MHKNLVKMKIEMKVKT